MRDEARIPLYIRVLPSVKNEMAEAAHQRRVSVARYVEEAVQDRLRREKEVSAGAE